MVLPDRPARREAPAADRPRAHARLPVRDPLRRQLPPRGDDERARSGSLEGMASYFGNDEDNKDRMVLRDAVLADQVPEIAADRAISGFFAYRFGHAVFDFIEAEWGKDAVRDFVFEFRNQIGGNVEKADQAGLQHLGRGLRHQVPPLPAAAVPEDPDREGRADRLRRALQDRGQPVGRALARAPIPPGDFVAAISTLQGRRRRRRAVHARTQALPEPDEGLHDRATSTSSRSG